MKSAKLSQRRNRKRKRLTRDELKLSLAHLESELKKAVDQSLAAKLAADRALDGMRKDRDYWKREYQKLTEPKPFGLWTWPKSQQNQSLSRALDAESIGG